VRSIDRDGAAASAVGPFALLETAGALGATVRDEAAFIERAESEVANDGEIDLLGFSTRRRCRC
jgi:hypothetical protein